MEARNLARTKGPLRAWLKRTERGWARASAALTTANEPYADLIEDRLGAGRPTVVLNTPPRYDPPSERPRRFHETLGLASETRVVLFHGGLVEERGVEQLMVAIEDVPGAVLVLLGYGPLVPRIETARADSAVAERVRLLPPVPPSELVGWVASADVVTMPIQPTTLNHRFTTPNRLWEAIAAGTPILASDLPGMAAVVRESTAGRSSTRPTRGDRRRSARPAGSAARAIAAMRGACSPPPTALLLEVEEVGYLALLARVTGRPW
jgi:glycosyltransferase involved in cell wall biosynthesis